METLEWSLTGHWKKLSRKIWPITSALPIRKVDNWPCKSESKEDIFETSKAGQRLNFKSLKVMPHFLWTTEVVLDGSSLFVMVVCGWLWQNQTSVSLLKKLFIDTVIDTSLIKLSSEIAQVRLNLKVSDRELKNQLVQTLNESWKYTAKPNKKLREKRSIFPQIS